jgi:uncharacterized membrane protein
MLEAVRSLITFSSEWVRLALETIGGLLIALGALKALSSIVYRAVHDHAQNFTADRLVLARALSLALEFQLAADILGTALSPTWQQIGRLAAIATIRTALNYTLTREIREERRGAFSSLAQSDS